MVEDLNNVDIKEFQVGEKVSGKVTKIEEKQVILDITDSKLDGIIPIRELSSLHIEKASDVVNVGDILDVIVTKIEEDALILSKRKMDAENAWKDLQTKFDANEIIEAEVKDVVKGGLVVDVGVRGFVPASLVETYFVENFDEYKGKTLPFKIVELDQTKNRVILSHRAVVEEMLAANKQQLLNSIEVGQIIEGTVQRITDFGAFVDIGGIDGLVHISQLSHQHVTKPSDVVEKGQKVTVKVLHVDKENERISLSIKETLPGPWSNISRRLKAGDIVEGIVKRLVSFGAFVEILEGVEGLVHISQISNKHISTPHEVLKEGDKIKVKVLDVNENEQRISLSMRELEEVTPEEDYSEYKPSAESSGFQLGEMIGDKLNKLK